MQLLLRVRVRRSGAVAARLRSQQAMARPVLRSDAGAVAARLTSQQATVTPVLRSDAVAARPSSQRQAAAAAAAAQSLLRSLKVLLLMRMLEW